VKAAVIRAAVLVGFVLVGCSKHAPATTTLPNGSATYGGASDDQSPADRSDADSNGGAVEPREPRPDPDGDPSGY
jgi:hypothetical protein